MDLRVRFAEHRCTTSQPEPSLLDLLEMQRLMSGVAPASPKDGLAFADMDPVRTAATFGALLTVPALQGNCARLEVLVHRAIALGKGSRKASAAWTRQMFQAIGDEVVGRLEDPAEDVFVTYCSTSSGGFRLLEGIWESNGFFLQRILDVLEGMPDSGVFAGLKRSVDALLRLSDKVCERAGLQRYDRGAPFPAESLSRHIADRLPSIRRRIRFDDADLAALGVRIEDLSPFVLPVRGLDGLEDRLGHSALERRPVAVQSGEIFLLLPTAVSAAIRRLVLETVLDIDQKEVFLAALGQSYLDLFEATPLLGGPNGENFHFHRTPTSALAGGTTVIDRGRYLTFIFVLDTLEDVEVSGLAGRNPDTRQITAELGAWLNKARDDARRDPEFTGGLALLVFCGVGRPSAHALPEFDDEDWRLESLSAAELVTLSYARDFKPLTLWRMLDARDALAAAGVQLQNFNGLLNLAAWNRSLGGHMVPHEIVPDDFASDEVGGYLVVPQNALTDLRHEVAASQDVHAVRDVAGRWRVVRRFNDHLFEQDNHPPIYTDETPRALRGVQGLFPTVMRDWWFDIIIPDSVTAGAAQDYWTTLMVWLKQAAPYAEAAWPDLPTGPLVIVCDFRPAATAASDDGPKPGTASDIRQDIQWVIGREGRQARLTIGAAFERGGLHVDNIAEQALVGALVAAMAGLASIDLDAETEASIVAQICPDPLARQRHQFAVSRFLDLVRADLSGKAVSIDDGDEALARLGLGWRVRDRSLGGLITEKGECMAFLNGLVRNLEDEICASLRGFNRTALVQALLYAHEASAAEGHRWERTAGAVLALRRDKQAVRAVMNEQTSKRAELSQTSRLLMEVALTEAPENGGRSPGKLDLSRLLTWAGLLLNYSGWSGAMRWDAMEPRLHIAALGDVLARLDLIDEVAAPFARAFSDLKVDAAVEGYEDNLREVVGTPTVEKEGDAAFYSALREVFGASFDEIRTFIDCLENLAARRGKAVMTVKRSEMIGLGNEHRRLTPAASEALLGALTLKPRRGWREDIDGIDPRDLDLWRLRRSISVLRRPLLQIDEASDPTLLLAPGLVRQAFLFMVGNYHDGSFQDWQLTPGMLKWKAREADRRGRTFSSSVADLLQRAGWSVAEPDIKVTKILGQGFDTDPGDIDVLAWKRSPDRVLAIECKDLQFKRSLGEIGEQMADFRGETVGKKRDYLRKHLDRMALIRGHKATLARFIGWDTVETIESHLVFKHPVPVQYALARMSAEVTVSTRATLLRTLEGPTAGR